MTGKTSAETSVIAQLIVLGAIWGGAFTLIKVLVHSVSPVEMAAGRLALGALALMVTLGATGRLRGPGRDLFVPIGVVALLDTVIPYLLVGWAESRIESGTASVLMSAMPLFTVMFAALTIRGESIGVARVGGVAVGFAGVLALIGSPAALRESGATGELAVICAAASYAAGALIARTLLKRVDAANFTVTKLAIGAAVATAGMLASGGGGGILRMDAGDAAALTTLGVLCTAFAFVMYFRVVEAVGSVGASTVTYIIPVFGLLIGVVALGESVEMQTLAGMALIVGGVAGVMYGPALEGAAARALARKRALSPA